MDTNMTGRNFGLVGNVTRRYNKAGFAKKHTKCVFYISDVSAKGLASCKFCGKQYS